MQNPITVVQKTDRLTVGCMKGNKVTNTDYEPLDCRGVINDASHFLWRKPQTTFT